MMTLLLIFYFFVSHLVFDILENRLRKRLDSPSWGVSSPPLSLAGLPLSSPGVSPRAPPMLWPAPPWSEVSPPHSALSTWRAPSHSPGVPRAETEDKRQIRGNKKAFCDRQRKNKKSTCSSLSTCCLCWSLAVWLWLSRTSLSSSSLLIFSLRRHCSWSKFLMVASWAIWVACKEPIWPESSQIEIVCVH